MIELDWEEWDRPIEKDSASGKLDFLVNEALAAKAQDERNFKYVCARDINNTESINWHKSIYLLR
jgi:hypothetical protein